MDELEPEQWFVGTVRNIVDFGVFVDIGVGEDGLIHISELSDGYVQSPYDVVCVGDRVRVRVVRVDKEKRRIALSMRKESAPRERRGHERRRRPAAESRAEARRADVEIPNHRPAGAIQTPRSTLGGQSRRFKKAVIGEPLSKTQQQILKKSEPRKPVEDEQEPSEQKKPEAGGLLEKLGFASIEKRGKRSE